VGWVENVFIDWFIFSSIVVDNIYTMAVKSRIGFIAVFFSFLFSVGVVEVMYMNSVIMPVE
jgi:hypothetical protein